MASELDFESRTIYEISLAVTDSPINGRLLDNQSRVIIEILDVDDNPPRLSPSLRNVTIVIDETDSGEIYSIDSNDINDFDTYPENREYTISIDTIRPVKFNRFLLDRMTDNGKWSIVASDGLDGFGTPDPFNQNDDDQVDAGGPNAPEQEHPSDDAMVNMASMASIFQQSFERAFNCD